MGMSKAVTLGIGLAFVAALIIWVLPLGHDDFTQVFYPAARAEEPYAPGHHFWYPVWTLYLLKGVAWLPVQAALVLVWLWNVSVVWACGRRPWLVLCSPPFLFGMIYGHPFEALIFLGITLVLQGYAGLGLMLLAFKPQLGLAPGLYVAWRHRREWRVFVPLAVLVVATTCLDFVLTGRLWVIPYWQVMVASKDFARWSVSLWQFFGMFSLLWLPIGLWVLSRQRDECRRLTVAYVLGLSVMPYWAGYSLWPLVAMAGCWAP